METRRQQQKQEAANAPASGLALLGFPPSWEFDAAFGNIWKLSGRNFRVALEFVNAIGLLYFWSLLRSPVQSCHIKGRIVRVRVRSAIIFSSLSRSPFSS